jgi:hypothetical protein
MGETFTGKHQNFLTNILSDIHLDFLKKIPQTYRMASAECFGIH